MKRFLKCFLLIVMGVTIVGCGGKDYSADWPDNKFTKQIPKPDTSDFEQLSEFDDYFGIDALKYSKEMYDEYLNKCEQEGFEFIKKDGLYSTFFNKDNYKLQLSYFDNSEKMYIYMHEPIELKQISWPSNAMTKLLPEFKASTGNVSANRSDLFLIYIGDVSHDVFTEYVKQCQNKGFNVDYDNSDNRFTAYNKDGFHLYLEYQDDGKNILTISLYEPSKNENEDTNETKTPNKPDNSKKESDTKKDNPNDTKNTSTKGVRKEIKDAIDSYEDFFNEYIKFMKKYESSDDTTDMTDDYLKYMDQYTETMKKMDDIQDKDLNDAELKYFADAQLRITDKLSQI